MPGKTDFDSAYAFSLQRILAERPHVNKRTGKQVRAIDGVFFRAVEIPVLNLRDINVLWTVAEAVWFLSGSSDARFMRRFGFKNWDPFTASDGNTVTSATGYRWRHASHIDQVGAIIRKLTKDYTDRQAVLTSWLPEEDLQRPGPNVPCLLAWHLHALRGVLHMTVMQRSADMYFGFPHDILGSRIIQEILAAAVELEPGNLSYAISNGHLYEDQWDNAREMIMREEGCGEKAKYPRMLGVTPSMVHGALEGDPATVEHLMEKIKKFYKPFPPLSGPRLVQ